MEEKLEQAFLEFKKYFETFDTENQKIVFKYNHTMRVVEYAKEIAISEKLEGRDYYLAVICGLLHDIARFKQAADYGTFIDALSLDHGDMGYEILKNNNYIDKYVENEEDKQIVLKAVKNHNKYNIEEGLTEKELYFAKLVRDADKIDIMDKQKNEILDTDYTVPQEAFDAMQEKRAMRRENKKSTDVRCVLEMICFCYDMNFERSFEIIGEKKIIKNKLEVLQKKVDSVIYENIEKIITNESFYKNYISL